MPGFQLDDRRCPSARSALVSPCSIESPGDPYRAIRDNQEALRIDPKHAAARRRLMALRAELAPRVPGLYEQGKRYFQDEQALTFTVDGAAAPGMQWPEARPGPVRPDLNWKIEAA